MNDTSKRTLYTREKQLNIFSLLFLGLLLIYFLMPAVQLAVKFYIILGIALVFTCAGFALTREQYGLKILLANIALIILFYFIGGTETIVEAIGKFHNYFTVCFPAILLSWFLPRSNQKQRWIIMGLVVVIYFVVLGNTFVALLENATAIRQNAIDMELKAENVGTYDFVYATGATIPFLAVCLGEVKEKWQKAVFAGLLVITLVLMFSFQYTIALLGAIVSVLCIPLLKEKNTKNKNVYLICILIAILAIQPILSFVIRIIPEGPMSIRLTEIAQFLSGEREVGYNLEGRFGLYWQAIKAFFQHPIIGNKELGFDTHSTILNVFAHLGIWGGILYIWILRRMKRRTEYLLQIQDKKWKFMPIFIYLIFVALTNPIQAAFITNAMVWFVLPLGLSLFERKEEDEEVGN